MAMRIQWSVELVTKTEIVPRLEDHLIDDLFYQEDEIGEMRHTAFMVECGLEEDPPDGPDVAPVPWGDMLLKIQREQNQINDDDDDDGVLVVEDDIVDLNDEDCNNSNNSSSRSLQRKHRELPSRSRSTDDIDLLAIELTSSPEGGRRIYHAHLAVPGVHVPRRCKSISLDMRPPSSLVNDLLSTQKSPDAISKQYVGSISSRRPDKSPKKHPPSKAASNDDIHNTELSLAFAKTERPSPGSPKSPTKRTISYKTKRDEEKRSPPVDRLLSKTKSRTSHDMGIDVAKARAAIESAKEDQDTLANQKSPPPIRRAPVTRSLMAAKSGTLHGMRTSVDLATKTEDAADNSTPKRGAPVVRRSLMAAKSGTLHGMRTSIDLATKTEDAVDNNNTEQNQNSTPKQGAPVVRRSLMAAKSGTLHGMRTSVDLAKKTEDAVDNSTPKQGAPVVRRSLMAAKSGTLHGMRTSIDLATKTEDAVDDNNTKQNQNSPPKRGAPVVRRSLMAAKSGTLHGMQKKIPKPEEISNIQREHSNNNNGNLSHSSNSSNNKKEIEHDKKGTISVVYKNGKKTIIRQPPSISHSCTHSVSDDDFLDDIVSSDDDTNASSDVSISTCGSGNDESPLIQQMDPIPKSVAASSVTSSSSKTPKKGRSSISKKNTTNISSPSVKKKISSKISSGSVISPSSTSSQPKDKSSVKKKKKKSKDLENKKDNGISVPSSPSPTKKKTTNSLLSETKSNLRSVSIRRQEIDLMQSQDEYLPSSDPSTKAHKITKKKKLKNSRASDIIDSRPDDWIGSEKTKRRSYKVKTKEKLDVPGDNL